MGFVLGMLVGVVVTVFVLSMLTASKFSDLTQQVSHLEYQLEQALEDRINE